MATKSIACPECGAAVAPGRYACAECGALLAALGTVPRTWASIATDAESAVPPPLVPARPREAVRRARRPKAPPAGSAATPVMPATPAMPAAPATAAPPVPTDAPLPAAAAQQPVPGQVAPAPPIAAAPRVAVESLEVDNDARREAAAIDDDRPLAAHAPAPVRPAGGEHAPGSLAAILAPEREDGSRPAAASTANGASTAALPAAAPVAALPPTPPAAARATAPIWPPAGDSMPVLTPPVRTPAGSYLAPSAVLPPLDAPLEERNGHAAHNGHVHATTPRRSGGRAAASTADGDGATVRASLGETLQAFGIPAEMPRRLVGGGAAIAGLGFLLPWIDALGGAGALLDSYLDYWGLSGPGHWIVAAALIALVAASFATGPLARLPVGAIGIAVSGVLLGLLWPYLFGVEAKSVGIWIVLGGTVLMAIGGVVELRRRHAAPEPGV